MAAPRFESPISAGGGRIRDSVAPRQRSSTWPRRPRGYEQIAVAHIERVAVVKFEVCPGSAPAPESFALDPALTVAWSRAKRPELPLPVTVTQETKSRWVIDFPLPAKVRCLALGERYGGLNLRGRLHTLLATDNPHHLESSDALYKSIPFLALEQGEQSIGVFLDSPAPQRWHLDRELDGAGRIELLSRRGWQLYLLGPARLPDVVAAFTRLTGRAELPPIWSLGHQQSRWSYPSELVVRRLAEQFRARKIPCDTLVLDIDYMDRYRVFTVSRKRFPEFERMVRALSRKGFHLVSIVDPGVAKTEHDPTYREGRHRGMFCRTPKGKLFVDEVWPGPACFPDFLRPEVRAWWGQKLGYLRSLGVAGIWNDMNEPAFFRRRKLFDPGSRKLPRDLDQPFLQQTPEGPVGHLEVRNLYGSTMAQATVEALRRMQPNQRPFVLSRSCYAGIQRFSAVWLGDNTSWFEHLRLSIPMLLNLGLSGVPFSGADVGGFGGDADGELLVRWYQLGIFYPFFRNHCARGHRAQEPWAFGARVERSIRRLIEARYRLLPYLQGLFVEHREQGAPIMRPLLWHYPEDSIAARIDDQFLFGRDLLVAPIVARGQTSRTVYLPRGKWYAFDGGPPLKGGGFHSVDWALDSVPAFVREGAILALADVVQHTGELTHASLTFRCYGSLCHGRFWQDDGRSLGYQRGEFNDWELGLRRGRFSVRARHLGFTAPTRRYSCEAMGKRWPVSLPTSPVRR
jgi:alpha-glucosidase